MSRDLSAIVEELAKNKTFPRPGYDGKAPRRIEASVELGKHTDGESTVELEMTVSHYKDSKCYVASLNIASVKHENGFISRSFSLLDSSLGGRLDSVDSPRYSAKALDAFWELQIHKLREDPAILAKLNLDHNQEVAA